MALGACVLSMMPTRFGVLGYLAPIAVITASYALFQAANNTLIMAGVGQDQRGVMAGLLSLSRNLGLITGASVMGAVFTLAASTTDVTRAAPDAVAHGMAFTFAVAAGLIGLALAIALPALKREPVVA
jgi:Na+/melibiose symporter-like transporter